MHLKAGTHDAYKWMYIEIKCQYTASLRTTPTPQQPTTIEKDFWMCLSYGYSYNKWKRIQWQSVQLLSISQDLHRKNQHGFSNGPLSKWRCNQESGASEKKQRLWERCLFSIFRLNFFFLWTTFLFPSMHILRNEDLREIMSLWSQIRSPCMSPSDSRLLVYISPFLLVSLLSFYYCPGLKGMMRNTASSPEVLLSVYDAVILLKTTQHTLCTSLCLRSTWRSWKVRGTNSTYMDFKFIFLYLFR